MQPEFYFPILAGLLLINLVLTGISFSQLLQYRKRQAALLDGEDPGKLADIVARQKQVIASHQKHLRELGKILEELVEQNRLHVQKVGIVRFNPFADTGGNMSFSLALLNADKNGIVISSLHSREGTRIYAKPVEKGESKHHLTDEERQAIAEAK